MCFGAGVRRLRQLKFGERDLPVRLKRRQTPERVVRGEGRPAEDDRLFQEPARARGLALVAAGEPDQQVEPAVILLCGQRTLEVIARGRRPPPSVELHAEKVVERPVLGRECRRALKLSNPCEDSPLLYLPEALANYPLELPLLVPCVVFEHDANHPLEPRALRRFDFARLLLPPLAPKLPEPLPIDSSPLAEHSDEPVQKLL